MPDPTVKSTIEWLRQFPEDARVYAYEGETTCIVVTKDGKELGYLESYE
jgi:hypothetical protein